MKFEERFISGFTMPFDEILGDWRSKSLAFWTMLGFEEVYNPEGNITFKSGSVLKNLYSFKSQEIPRTVTVFVRENELVFRYEPNLAFRAELDDPSDPDIPYLNWEVAEFAKYLAMSVDELENYSPEVPNTVGKSMHFALKLILKSVLPALIILCVVIGVTFFKERRSIGIVLEKGSFAGKTGRADVYLMPFYGFDESLAGGLAKKLSEDLNLNVKVSTAMPLEQSAYDSNRRQFNCVALTDAVRFSSGRILDYKLKTIYIGLLHGSLYDPNTTFRFVFAMRANDGFAVVGNYEMAASSEKLYNLRMYKILKRTIGGLYYKYPPSNNIKSVMNSPLMSTVDLDNMGVDFDSELILNSFGQGNQ